MSDEFTPHSLTKFFTFILMLSSCLYLVLPSGLFPTSHSEQILLAFLISPTHPNFPVCFILLYFITVEVYSEMQIMKLFLWNFHHSFVTLPLMRSQMLFNTSQTPSIYVLATR